MKLLRNQFSLANLQVFVTVARLGSFTRAAEHISLTQSAVSKQVAALEDALGVSLFVRAGGVRLTSAGRDFLHKIEPALEQITRTVETLAQEDDEAAVVNLLAPPAVLQFWLISLLPDFVAAHPEIDLRLSPRLVSIASPRLDLDAEIRFGSGVWQGVRARYLFGREMCVVASPAWLDDHPLLEPSDFANLRVFGHSLYPTAWMEWSQAMGVKTPHDVQSYDHYSVMVEAIIAGLGVGIMPRLLVRKLLSSGKVVAPFNEVMLGSSGYYLVLSDHLAGSRHIKVVGDWIRDQADLLATEWLACVSETVHYVRR